MNRQSFLFSSRAKVRREKFASTRKSLSESLKQTFPQDENAPFVVLPSPTIGEESGIPERLSAALSPLVREHQLHHHHAHHQHHTNFFMMSSTTKSSSASTATATPHASSMSGSSDNVVGTTASFSRAGKKLSCAANINTTSGASLLTSSSRSSSEERVHRHQQQHQHRKLQASSSVERPHPKWSPLPRLKIVRQLSQPVLRTAEIVDTKQQAREAGSMAVAGPTSTGGSTTSSGGVGGDLTTAATATSTRYLPQQQTSARSYDWNKDVSIQCNIFQLSHSAGGEEPQYHHDRHHHHHHPDSHGPPRTKSERLEKFRRCKSFDWDHFRKCEEYSPWEPNHKSSLQTCSRNQTTSSIASGRRGLEGGNRSAIEHRPGVNKPTSSRTHLIKSTESADAFLPYSPATVMSSASRVFQESSTIHSSIAYSPPMSPRRLRFGMANIFSFGSGSSKEKTGGGGGSKSSGLVMRKMEPPTHLDLFGSPPTSATLEGAEAAAEVTTVFETTVCKKCALLMPQLAGHAEKPELMQQETQTDFSSLVDFTRQQESESWSSGSSTFPTTMTTTTTSAATNRILKTTPSTSSVVSPTFTTTTTRAASGCSTTSPPSSVYVCQKHQERLLMQQQSQHVMQQQRQSTPTEHSAGVGAIMPSEKKYVPSPLAAEKWKHSASSSSEDHGLESPSLNIGNTSTTSSTTQSHTHHFQQHQQHHHHQPHHHHHHHLFHRQQQNQLKKHSLAFSLPIPQLALQYANIPSGDTPPPCCSTSCVSPHSSFGSPPNSSGSCSTAVAGPAMITTESLAEGRGKSSTLPTIDSKHIVAIRNAEKRRRFFAKKQTNSAPDTFDSHTFLTATQGVLHTTRRLCGNCKEPVTNCLDGVLRSTRRDKDTPAITPPSVEVWESEIRTARCGNVAVTHVSELDYPDADPPCHFCCEQASTAIHDASRLQIVSGGLVRSRDGSARGGSAPYINLPSPNVQAENGQQAVFPSLELSPSMSQTLSPGSHYDHPANAEKQSPPTRGGSLAGATCGSRSSIGGSKEEEDPLVGPPASSLTRRPALVPPKLIPDPDYENDADRDKNSCRNEDNTSPRARRSSIVVIPPMQICPGDLLVYGKCLSQRKSLLGTTIETPSPIQNVLETENTTARKGKASWSLLKLFERGSRPKGGPSGAIEEIMSLIQPCDYSDPKLTRFKGMCWSDFVNHVANQKVKKTGSCGSVTSGSSSEGSQSNQPVTGTTLTKGPKDQGGEGGDANTKSDNHLVHGTESGGGAGNSSGSIGSGATLVAIGHPILTSTPSAPAAQSSAATSSAKEDKTSSIKSPKPLVRKRMGLMRTMSDRCLERRITPALFRGTQGFLMGEKLVEGKESEPTGDNGSSKGGKPFPLNQVKSEKDLLTKEGGSKDAGTSSSSVSTASTSASGPSHQPPPEESISDPDLRQKMRQKEALWDLFQSECSFLYDHLMVLKNVFLEPLKRIQVEGIAMYAEPELLFGNLDELCGVTYAFCKEFIHLLLKLTDAAGELSTTEVLAKLFEPSSKARTLSQAYHRYALNYINALNYLETLRRQQEFTEFEKLCMKDPRCKKLQLTDLLVSPVQHIMKVPLILKDIQSRTNEPQEKELILQILEIQENSIRELDDKMRWLKNYERLLEIQRNIVWPSILEMEPKTWVPEFLRVALSRQPCDSIIVSPRRQIIHEGLLQLWDTGKASETYVILFDDMLLITRRKKGLSKKKSSLTENWQSACGKSGSVVGSGLETNHRYIVYRQPISLDRFFIHDIAEAENTSAKLDYAFVLVALNRFQQIVAVHTFQAPSDQVKNLWLLKLKTTQEKWKRTLQTTVFRGVRSSTDSGQSNVASSLVFGLNKQFMRHNEA